MCGGGELGGANNESNDDKKGSGNSFGESLANAFTPNDGFSYVDGRLTADKDRGAYTPVYSGNPNEAASSSNRTVDDGKGGYFQVPKNETKEYNDGIVRSAIFGALTGGIPGIALGMAGNAVRNNISPPGDTNKIPMYSLDNNNRLVRNANAPSLTKMAAKTKTPTGIASGVVPGGYTDPNTYIDGVHYNTTNDGGFKGMFQAGGTFAGPQFNSAEERSQYMLEQKNKFLEETRMGGNDDNNRVRQTVATPTAPAGPSGPATSDMSAAAAQGGFEPIPNPDYDPNDPMSPKFIINPSYQQLLEYQQSQVTNMRGGGYPGQIGNPRVPLAMLGTYGKPSYSEPLQQYGSYLESQYGDAGFDQKKDNFLQEVNNKEQQTFGQGGLGSMFMAQPRPHLRDPRGPMFGTHQGGPGQLGMPEGYDKIQGAFPHNLITGQNRGFAEGGELEQVPQEGIAAVAAPQEGGNEKTDIADAVMAVKGDMSKEEASVVLGKFLANYGEEALRDLVEKVKSGEYDDTKERFANGEAGEVNGPGDGSGVDDKVPASLEGKEDVLLADGEYVLRAETAKSLENMYGIDFLDTLNESEKNAPRVLREFAAKTATA